MLLTTSTMATAQLTAMTRFKKQPPKPLMRHFDDFPSQGAFELRGLLFDAFVQYDGCRALLSHPRATCNNTTAIT